MAPWLRFVADVVAYASKTPFNLVVNISGSWEFAFRPLVLTDSLSAPNVTRVFVASFIKARSHISRWVTSSEVGLKDTANG